MEVRVQIDSSGFTPNVIDVNQGDTVRFINSLSTRFTFSVTPVPPWTLSLFNRYSPEYTVEASDTLAETVLPVNGEYTLRASAPCNTGTVRVGHSF